jgi:hypothetical protein
MINKGRNLMTNMTRFIALVFLTLIAFFLGLAPIKADEPSKVFYYKEYGKWETVGQFFPREGYRLCTVRTEISSSQMFGIQIGVTNDLTPGAKTFAFVNNRWKLKKSPDEGGHYLEGTLVIKEFDGKTSGMQIEYGASSPNVALIYIKDMSLIMDGIKGTKTLSFAPEDGRMAVTADLEGLIPALETTMVECLKEALEK